MAVQNPALVAWRLDPERAERSIRRAAAGSLYLVAWAAQQSDGAGAAVARAVGGGRLAASILATAEQLGGDLAALRGAVALHYLAGSLVVRSGRQVDRPLPQMALGLDAVAAEVAGAGGRLDALGVWNPFKKIGKALKKVGKLIKRGVGAVGKLADAGLGGLLRRVLGKKIGGTLWNLIKVLMGSTTKITYKVVKGTLAALLQLTKGRPLEAVKVLLATVTSSLLYPALAPLGAICGLSPKRIDRMLDAVAKKNPMFPLQLVSFALSVVSINVQQIVIGAIGLLRPVVGAFVRAVAGTKAKLSSKAIDVVFSIVSMAAQGVASMGDLVDGLAARMKVSAAKLRARFKAVWSALRSFNLGKLGPAILKVAQGDNGKKLRAVQKKMMIPDAGELLRAGPKASRRFVAALLGKRAGREAIGLAVRRARPNQARQVLATVMQKKAGRDAVAAALRDAPRVANLFSVAFGKRTGARVSRLVAFSLGGLAEPPATWPTWWADLSEIAAGMVKAGDRESTIDLDRSSLEWMDDQLSRCEQVAADLAWAGNLPADHADHELGDAWRSLDARTRQARALFDSQLLAQGAARRDRLQPGAAVAPALGAFPVVLVVIAAAAVVGWTIHIVAQALNERHKIEILTKAATEAGKLPELIRAAFPPDGVGAKLEEAAGDVLRTLGIGAGVLGAGFLVLRAIEAKRQPARA